MNYLKNIQYPTPNIEHPINSSSRDHWMFDVGCWMLDVFEFSGGSRE